MNAGGRGGEPIYANRRCEVDEEAVLSAELVPVADYAERIRNLWTASVEAFIECGRQLVEAKAALPRGQFEKMVESELPFGPRTAQRLMAVAEHPLLSQATHVSHLPPSWGTLYELSRLPEPVLEAALADGRITPQTERRDVLCLRDETRREALPTIDRNDTCDESDLARLVAKGRLYGTIYADPPWQYGNQGTRASTDNHYSTMTVADIAALPIGQLAAPDAHLHLWTTNAFLFEAKAIIDAWGFEYKSVFVWVKTEMGIGNYWRVSHEFLLLGVRGSAPFRDRGQLSWMEESRRIGHSKKPEAIRQKIELVSPGPYLELFGRRGAPGWTVWGNEIERTMFNAEMEAVG